MEKIKDSKIRHAILDHLHMVMFMSIDLDETIDDFKTHGGRWWWKVLIIYKLVLFGQDIFGLIIANLVSKGFLSKYGIIKNMPWMHVHFSHRFESHHQLKVCCACPCKALDGSTLSSPTLESRYKSSHRIFVMGL